MRGCPTAGLARGGKARMQRNCGGMAVLAWVAFGATVFGQNLGPPFQVPPALPAPDRPPPAPAPEAFLPPPPPPPPPHSEPPPPGMRGFPFYDCPVPPPPACDTFQQWNRPGFYASAEADLVFPR